jgi:hypothetical protein
MVRYQSTCYLVAPNLVHYDSKKPKEEKLKTRKRIFPGPWLIALMLASVMSGYGQAQNFYAEASTQASNHWLQEFKSCGDSFFSKNFIGGGRERRFIGYTEWKGLKWSVEGRPITTAEQLNGVQWKGVTFVFVSAYRIANGVDGDWSDWVPGFNHSPEVQLTKVNGQWRVTDSYSVRVGMNDAAVSCQEIATHQQRLSKTAPARRSAARQVELNNQLIEEIRDKDDLAKIRELLRAGADPNWREYVNSDTALVYALYSVHAAETVRLLLSSGADPNVKNYAGDPVLLYAVMQNNTAVVQAFVEKGVNPNVAKSKQYPLITAATCSPVAQCTEAPAIVRLLIKGGADTHVKDLGGSTALDLAQEKLRDARQADARKLYQDIVNVLQSSP